MRNTNAASGSPRNDAGPSQPGGLGEGPLSVVEKPRLFWLCLNVLPDQPELTAQATAHASTISLSALASRFLHDFSIRFFRFRDAADLKAQLATATAEKPILVFEYDQPGAAGRALLRDIRLEHRSLPIVLFTLDHSEELAVWALRNRVWDYFVKPIPDGELRGIIDRLRQWQRNGLGRGTPT